MDTVRSHLLTVVVWLPWCMSIDCRGTYEGRCVSIGSGEGRKVGKAAKARLTGAGVGDPSWCAARHIVEKPVVGLVLMDIVQGWQYVSRVDVCLLTKDGFVVSYWY